MTEIKSANFQIEVLQIIIIYLIHILKFFIILYLNYIRTNKNQKICKNSLKRLQNLVNYEQSYLLINFLLIMEGI